MDNHAPADELDRRLAGLKDALADAMPPPGTDVAIAQAMARAAKRSPTPTAPRFPGRRFAWPLALAATIVLAVVALRTIPDTEVSPLPSASASTPSRFMPVVPVAEIERSTDGYVVRARVPRMALAQFGLPVNPARADDAVDTEVLVRPDGAVLALRFTP